MRGAIFGLTIMALLGPVGCDSNEIQGRLPISGTVTVDGKPLENGVISFAPLGDDKTVNATVKVEDGKYETPANGGLVPGEFLVSITSSSDNVTSDDPVKAMQQAAVAEPEKIPVKYNRQSELRATVTGQGPQVFNFGLKTK